MTDDYKYKTEKQKDKNVCLRCGAKKRKFYLKLIPTNRGTLEHFPKFIPQVKAICSGCDCFVKFEKQTKGLIKTINNQLKNIQFTYEN